ncbi:MAG: hypothetical protein OEX97_04580 [Acidimicrobiia bacterium]|nr:hypothetical protein [Acidimicrobiia bacterium]
MTDRRTPSIHISQDLADLEAIPDDLDSGVLGPYEFPSPARRRLSAWVYLVGGAVAAAGAIGGLPTGMWLVAGMFVVLAGWHFITAWSLVVSDSEALERAARAVSFPVGHSSGAVRFEGWRSRPIWNVLLYSADDPPSRRGLVLIDAVTGELRGETYEEELLGRES